MLPFNLSADNAAATRELYLHGEDAQRPGYTLQELFRLARSTIIQQRTAALTAIGGLLSIYHQGFYDQILEVPISKIFFLLRYALDDNTPAMLEAASKALSILFYHQTDEVLLDLTFDCATDIVEPTLAVHDDISEDENSAEHELSAKFAGMNLSKPVFRTEINDDEDSVASMNDFHLAETDLVKCLLRTNILQRIRYFSNQYQMHFACCL